MDRQVFWQINYLYW